MALLEAKKGNIGPQRVSRRMVKEGTLLFLEDVRFLKRIGFSNRDILNQYGDDILLKLKESDGPNQDEK